MPANQTAPIRAAHAAAVAKLSALQAPRIFVSPDPEDFEAVNTYLLDVARIVDELILSVGRDIRSNATTTVDLKLFTDVVRDALEGNATFCITTQAEAVQSERAGDLQAAE